MPIFCRILVTLQTNKLLYNHNKSKMPVINSNLPFTSGPDPFRIFEEPMFGSSSNQYACQVCLTQLRLEIVSSFIGTIRHSSIKSGTLNKGTKS